MFVIVLVTIVCALFVYWCFSVYKQNKLLSKIPGPPPIPFFSCRLPKDNYDIYHMLNELIRKYGKTFKIYLGPSLHVITCDKNFIEAVLKSTDHISKSTMYDLMSAYLLNGLIVSDGDKWMSRRKLCNPAFHFSYLKDLLNIFKTKSDIMIENLIEEEVDGIVNIHEHTSKYQLDVFFISLIGIDMEVQKDVKNEYIEASHTFVSTAALRNFSIWKRYDLLFYLFAKDSTKNSEAVKFLNNFGKKIISDRRRTRKSVKHNSSAMNSKKTLLDMLLDQPHLTDDDILEEINNFLIAGYETTGTATAAMAVELSLNKGIQEKLYEDLHNTIGNDFNNLTIQKLQDMKYLDFFAKEMLRLRTPVPLIERVLKEDAVFENTMYPKGTTISLLLYVMHHQHEYYPDPEKMCPERFAGENKNFPFHPFSKGLRNCIGQKYAMIALKTLIARLVWEFEFLPVEGFKFEVGYGSVLLSKNGFPVRLRRRQH